MHQSMSTTEIFLIAMLIIFTMVVVALFYHRACRRTYPLYWL